MDYPKSTPNVGLVGGKFADENASTGQPGSLIPASWGNAVTDEVLAVIKAGGLTPSEDDTAQLLKAIQGIAASDIKRAVRVTTTGPIALSGLQTIDGVALQAGDRVLVKDQANPAQNWIYTASTAAWARALDASTDAQCAPGHVIIVQAGSYFAGALLQLTNTVPPQVGTTALNFGLLFGRSGVTAGSYRQVSVDVMGRVMSGSNPTTLAGYGITDGLKRGETGLGATVVAPGSIDQVGQPGGFYTFGDGATSFAQYSALVNLPYIDERFGAQIGLVFGGPEPKLAFRMCNAPGVWGATRYAWHDGNFDPAVKADKSTTYTKAQVDSIVAGKANNAITLGGYGITDAYTVTQVNSLLAGKANNATTLAGYGIADAYTATQVNNLLAGKAGNATTLAGYGITDALKRGDSGLGVPLLAGASSIDQVGLKSGFHMMGAGATSLANYCSVLHLPYDTEGYAAQIAILQAQSDVEVRVRACKSVGQWGPTRRLLTDGNLATSQMAIDGTDDVSWLSPAKLKAVLTNKLFGAFAVSLGANGYLAFPSWLGGLIFQWGRITNAAVSGTTANLAIAFPNSALSANCSAIGNLASGTHEITEIMSLTQTNLVVSNNGGGSVAWWAVGY